MIVTASLEVKDLGSLTMEDAMARQISFSHSDAFITEAGVNVHGENVSSCPLSLLTVKGYGVEHRNYISPTR